MLIQKDLLNKLIDLANISIEYLNAKDEDVTWITVKGNHIPIKKGQTKKEAFDKFIEEKSKDEDEDELVPLFYKIDTSKNNSDITKHINKNTFTTEENKSLESYKADDFEQINYLLRTGKDLGITKNYKKDISNIDNAFTKSKTNSKLIVYRGLNIHNENMLENFKNLNVKDEIILSGYTSTSISEQMADKFTNNYKLKINVPKGTPAINMEEFANKTIKNELEVLLPNNLKIKIKNIQKEKNYTLIEGEVIQ